MPILSSWYDSNYSDAPIKLSGFKTVIEALLSPKLACVKACRNFRNSGDQLDIGILMDYDQEEEQRLYITAMEDWEMKNPDKVWREDSKYYHHHHHQVWVAAVKNSISFYECPYRTKRWSAGEELIKIRESINIKKQSN